MNSRFVFLFVFLTGMMIEVQAQSILSRPISIQVNRQRLDQVLEIISNKGDFYFSYNSGIIKKDSLISFTINNRTVKDVLQLLFDKTYEFKESGNYIIIRKAPIRMTVVVNKAATEDKYYAITGHVFDEQTGLPIIDASIYEKTTLAAVLTNTDGYFKIRLRSSKSAIRDLTISKTLYEDTVVKIIPKNNMELTITLLPIELPQATVTVSPNDYISPDSIQLVNEVVPQQPFFVDTAKVEKKGLSKFLLSTNLRRQSLNLGKYITSRPFQISFTPGLSTHGALSGQVVNNVSLNILGGYTAGTNGVELGGLFNIDKKDVSFFQAAGLFNTVGGKVKGVQFAGVHNTVLDSVRGLQAAGVSNVVKGNMDGVQLAGVHNHVTDSVFGLQAAGVTNFVHKRVKGVQLAGVANIALKETEGAQIAGVLNYSHRMKGIQIGLINIADSSDGYSIGLINIIFKGYHSLSLSTNEFLPVNIAFKTGNTKLYSILIAGTSTKAEEKAYTFGYGMGSLQPLNKKKTLFFNPELTTQSIYLGSWDYLNLMSKLHFNINVKAGKYLSFYAGPSVAVLVSDQTVAVPGYRFPIAPTGNKGFSFSNRVTGWFGWSAGINIF